VDTRAAGESVIAHIIAISDRIERTILLKTPRSRVWRALSNAEEFGDWFGVALKGESSTAGQRVRGHVTHRGYEHVVLEMSIEGMESESLLSWHWHPAAIEPSVDYSQEPTTLVVFDLQEVQGGVRLNIVESGFDGVPPARRLEAFRLNSGGWDGQIDNIAKHVAAS
jgi:uncharacterized protein YndB with AHSA1/START domain